MCSCFRKERICKSTAAGRFFGVTSTVRYTTGSHRECPWFARSPTLSTPVDKAVSSSPRGPLFCPRTGSALCKRDVVVLACAGTPRGFTLIDQASATGKMHTTEAAVAASNKLDLLSGFMAATGATKVQLAAGTGERGVCGFRYCM